MFEEILLRHCSPTLAGIKTGSLFNYPIRSPKELSALLHRWNQELNEKGIFLLLLKAGRRHGLIYVYRQSQLEKELEQKSVQDFLKAYGYRSFGPRETLLTLWERFSHQEEFPHEIGVFLGYPLGDVIGFIENAGQNCKCAGCWKVYCDECKARETFARFHRCRRSYQRMFSLGKTIKQLTIAA